MTRIAKDKQQQDPRAPEGLKRNTWQKQFDKEQPGSAHDNAEDHAKGPDYGQTNMSETDCFTVERLIDKHGFAEMLHTVSLFALDEEL